MKKRFQEGSPTDLEQHEEVQVYLISLC